MDLIFGLMTIAAIYLWVLFMDRFFKSCSHYGYIQFLKGTGLEIKLFQFSWTTTAFNKLLLKWGSHNTKFLNLWFNLGLCVSLVLLPASIYLLLVAFFQNFLSSASGEESIIQPVVPGINLPASEMGYYSLTLLISSVLHELGHALGAVQEDVNVINVGANVIFILPVAYVNLNSDKLFSLNPWKRLKILCAGVWHNLLIALVAYLLYTSLPSVFSPFFNFGKGVVVTEFEAKSPIFGNRGLNVGDLILKINDCEVDDENAWYKCLVALRTKKPAFCIEGDVVRDLDESVHLKHSESGIVSCCHSENKGKLCFEYLDSKDSILELPPYACLPGRPAIEASTNFCISDPHVCPKDTYCFRPILTNNTNLFKIKRVNKNDVIYIGPVSDLVRTVTVSSYVPKYSFLGTRIPDVTTKFLGYLAMFSMGLALVNILPCLFMDGQHITNTLFHIIFASHLRTTHIKIISGVVTASFTLLLVIHCVIVIWTRLN
ncbi:membrane-bound transcription factor site-2 protease [Tribolium castaneum]|uniref:Membrane-bound transcription factor site-2 protease n=1 Tax=Tribolium castaneum TaxID=7070 RepID=D6WA43_TRICA|nr:PREDICTED: membrane-bound transcription factor site-2 protease [Tribolium castaneum]EEZ98063.1 Membrane-bound transcription factor site-2 protease-like Protein [Tribolium castaneum]|eukprot:XP_967961.1 PREDICTED: membrane-bound transcription factor site-2 protease [Tribolium castaneum]